MLSDNDPYTSDHVENAALWQSRLGAQVQLIEGAKHFNGAEAPSVFELLKAIALAG